MTRVILAVLVSLLFIASPVSASTPKDEYTRAVEIVSEFKSDISAAVDVWREDPLQKIVVENAITKGLTGLESIIVDDCFAEWYAFQYASLFIVYMFFANAETPEVLDQPSNGFLSPAVYMTQVAGSMTPNC